MQQSESILFAFARISNPFLVRRAFRRGHTNLEEQDKNGNTPLFIAVKNGHLETAKMLVSLGANPHHRIGTDRTIWHVAIETHECDKKMFKFLRKISPCALKEIFSSGKTLLDFAISKQAKIAIKQLFKFNARINVTTFAPNCLYWRQDILECESKSIVRRFQQRGISFAVADEKGHTPLHIYLAHCYKFKLLRELKVDYDAIDHKGRTPLLYALLPRIDEPRTLRAKKKLITNLHVRGSEAHYVADASGRMPQYLLCPDGADFLREIYFSRSLLETVFFSFGDSLTAIKRTN
jgi:ankyrin repeat protein